MANDEMKRVCEADYDHIEQNKNILKFYYGATDGWTPVKYCQQLKEKVPNIDAQIDIYQFSHAFVLRSSIEMGKLVGGWILQNKIQ